MAAATVDVSPRLTHLRIQCLPIRGLPGGASALEGWGRGWQSRWGEAITRLWRVATWTSSFPDVTCGAYASNRTDARFEASGRRGHGTRGRWMGGGRRGGFARCRACRRCGACRRSGGRRACTCVGSWSCCMGSSGGRFLTGLAVGCGWARCGGLGRFGRSGCCLCPRVGSARGRPGGTHGGGATRAGSIRRGWGRGSRGIRPSRRACCGPSRARSWCGGCRAGHLPRCGR